MTELALIVAMDRNRCIGREGGMPWHLPADLAHFKATTMGQPIAMGRRTFDSIGRALPGRRNLVISRSAPTPPDGTELVRSVAEAIDRAQTQRLFIIGGGEIYRQTIERADVLYVTHIDTAVEGGDTFFPVIDADIWEAVAETHHNADAKNRFDLRFVEYRRR